MQYLKEFDRKLSYYFSELLERPFSKPLWVYISLSHKCTYKCQMCEVVKILNGYELKKDTVESLFDNIASWKWGSTIVITGGEPFLRKDIFELISYASAKGLNIEAVSNGSLIDEELASKIISSGLQNIAISLDGATQNTHDFVRQAGAFKKALSALTNLAKAKQRAGSGPQISVWTTIMKENTAELFDIIALVKGLGVECLVYHPVIVAQDDMQNTSANANFWIKDRNLDVLKDQLDRITAYQRKHGLVAFLHNPYLWIDHFKGTLTKKEWKCNPFVFVNIGPDGELRSCGSSFGNIEKMKLEECLNTQEAYKARKIMKSCDKPCLQTCWAYPESDSLLAITDTFIADVRKSSLTKEDKRRLFKSALSKLSEYELITKEEYA